MANTFTCVPRDVRSVTTSRGIAATARIRKNGEVAAVLDDQPHHIVAIVAFTTPALRTEFLAEAKANGFTESTDDFTVSEYARHLSYCGA